MRRHNAAAHQGGGPADRKAARAGRARLRRLEGLTKPEIKARDPDSWRARAADKWNVPVPGGESHGMVSARVARWLEEQDRDSRLIVVSHGMAGRALRACYAGLPGDAITGLTEDHAQVFRLADGRIASFDAVEY